MSNTVLTYKIAFETRKTENDFESMSKILNSNAADTVVLQDARRLSRPPVTGSKSSYVGSTAEAAEGRFVDIQKPATSA